MCFCHGRSSIPNWCRFILLQIGNHEGFCPSLGRLGVTDRFRGKYYEQHIIRGRPLGVGFECHAPESAKTSCRDLAPIIPAPEDRVARSMAQAITRAAQGMGTRAEKKPYIPRR